MEKVDCKNCKNNGRSYEKKAYFRKKTEDYKCPTCGNVFKSGLQKLEKAKITMPKEKAKEEWKKYVELLKKRKEKYLEIMKKAHYEMKKGNELIDIYKVMKESGLNDKDEPKLAISRADRKEVIFCRKDSGTGSFEMEEGWNRAAWKTDINLPQKTFNIHWEREEGKTQEWSINKQKIKTKVPILPAELIPEGDLKNYYILWEPLEWEELPETKDQILLRRISENLFAILGCWDLTELEQSIIRGNQK